MTSSGVHTSPALIGRVTLTRRLATATFSCFDVPPTRHGATLQKAEREARDPLGLQLHPFTFIVFIVYIDELGHSLLQPRPLPPTTGVTASL